jgi:hypothetical protein
MTNHQEKTVTPSTELKACREDIAAMLKEGNGIGSIYRLLKKQGRITGGYYVFRDHARKLDKELEALELEKRYPAICERQQRGNCPIMRISRSIGEALKNPLINVHRPMEPMMDPRTVDPKSIF